MAEPATGAWPRYPSTVLFKTDLSNEPDPHIVRPDFTPFGTQAEKGIKGGLIMESHSAYDTIIEANNPVDTIVRHSDGGVIYTVARPEHRQGILEVLARAFVNEPSTAGQSIDRPGYNDWYRFTEFYMDECITNGLSIVALDGLDGRTVAGAFINRDFLRPPDPRIIEFVSEPSPFAPVVGALDVIDKAWFAVHPEIDRTEVGRVVDLWMVGVHPGYRSRRIASNLSALSLTPLWNAQGRSPNAPCRLQAALRFMNSPIPTFAGTAKPYFGTYPAPTPSGSSTKKN
jgi:ribosomal protein S18 acetylase RimI-like enzyme